jgi:ADP-ribose pyrophosphatase
VESLPARRIGTRTEAQVLFLTVEVDTFRDRRGIEFERVTVRHPGAVAIVPVLDDSIILLRQFRAPLQQLLLEIPAGKLDVEGEAPEAAAGRECEEEVGYRPGRLLHLRTIYTTPGFSDERIELYLATDLSEVGARPDGIEEHHAEIVRLRFAEVRSAMERGEITDAKTLIALEDALRMVDPGSGSLPVQEG